MKISPYVNISWTDFNTTSKTNMSYKNTMLGTDLTKYNEWLK